MSYQMEPEVGAIPTEENCCVCDRKKCRPCYDCRLKGEYNCYVVFSNCGHTLHLHCLVKKTEAKKCPVCDADWKSKGYLATILYGEPEGGEWRYEWNGSVDEGSYWMKCEYCGVEAKRRFINNHKQEWCKKRNSKFCP